MQPQPQTFAAPPGLFPAPFADETPPALAALRPVLYVEDQAVNVLVMQALFAHRPMLALAVAGDAAGALERARGLEPVLLLLDLDLPDLHGSVLLPLLRALPGCEAAPAVAVTADTGFDAIGAGFVDVWPKPLDLSVLMRLDLLLASGTTVARSVCGALPKPEMRRRTRQAIDTQRNWRN